MDEDISSSSPILLDSKIVHELEPHRSHDPAKNLKRSDPFKFGSRYLKENDDVYEFNAWDHVIPDDAYYAYAEAQYASQREHPVSDFDKGRFNAEPEKWWNKFYSNNTSNFFKNRKWLHQEFPILTQLTKKGAGPARILEVGAGAGNTCFPILAENENDELSICACDFSEKAVNLVRANEKYDGAKIKAEIWDLASEDLPHGISEESVDVVLLIFVFSALNPVQWEAAVGNVWKVLKPGGQICFRDYGRGDLTQVRFKKGRLLDESFYIRGDGTRVYFFDEDELRGIWAPGDMEQSNPSSEASASCDWSENCSNPSTGGSKTRDKPTFEIVKLGADRRMLVNRQKQLKMYRCWLQGQFKKPAQTIHPG
ncbi:MAG: hypothetical protein OHK93_002243 [Ramalina farinacea]|uniref:tRNA N(3)-methylcytidine methyltransferase n=1 Tax=Ramalina farinacea TaxID=258253 RepID=A0AA43QR08_9LECA|nr:hypothetical protein [Ramalina farinacea]